MLKDIIIYNGEDIIDYKYEVVNGELVISFDLDKELDSVNVIYDINVYEKIKFNKLKVKKRFEDEVEVFLKGNKSVTFNLRVNNKFFVKSVYSFINRFSKKSELLDNLNLFKFNSVIVASLLAVVAVAAYVFLSHKKETTQTRIDADAANAKNAIIAIFTQRFIIRTR